MQCPIKYFTMNRLLFFLFCFGTVDALAQTTSMDSPSAQGVTERNDTIVQKTNGNLRMDQTYNLISYEDFVKQYGSKPKSSLHSTVFIIEEYIYANLTSCIERSDGSPSTVEEVGYVNAKIEAAR